MKTLLLSGLLLLSLSGIGATHVNIYDWKWAIPKEKTNCRIDVEIVDLLFDFDSYLKESVPERFAIRFQPGGFDYYFATKEEAPPIDEVSILVFALCEENIFGVRAFMYSHRSNKLIREIAISTASVNINDIPAELSKRVIYFLENPYAQEASREERAENRFQECIQRHRVNYLYREYIKYVEESEENPLEEPKKNLNTIFQGIEHYLETENYDFLVEVRKIRESKGRVRYKGRLNRYEKKYPRLITLIDALVLFENYRDYNYDAQVSLRGYVERTISDLLYNEEPISDREAAVLDRLPVEYDELAKRLGRGLIYITNCQQLFATKFDDPEKELAMYLEVLNNSDISPVLKSRNQSNDNNCANLKREAVVRIKKILNDRQDVYLQNLQFADSLQQAGDLERALIAYGDLNTAFGHVSFLVDNRQYLAQAKLENNTGRFDVIAVLKEKLNFNSGSGLSLENTFDVELDTEGNVSVVIERDSNVVNSWLSEVNYYTGSYKSRYQDGIEEQIAEALIAVYRMQGDRITSIDFQYLGSSDRAGFKSKGRLKVKDRRYTSLPEVRVCENAIYDFSDTEYRYRGQKVAWTPQCLAYDDLIEGSAMRQERFSHYTGELIDLDIKQNSDYSKNLALAYLRAKNRHDTILDLMDGGIPEKKLFYDIKTEVAPELGFQYRFVNLKITIRMN